jgi:hypothetical protein
VNIFANPVAVSDSVRAPILGIDKRTGGFGPITGLPYWNVDLSITKNSALPSASAQMLRSSSPMCLITMC